MHTVFHSNSRVGRSLVDKTQAYRSQIDGPWGLQPASQECPHTWKKCPQVRATREHERRAIEGRTHQEWSVPFYRIGRAKLIITHYYRSEEGQIGQGPTWVPPVHQ
jgi:hypothetical protein